jgi:hypothetical protein
MGFWDFLHGITNQKSEAEEYMEKRNKEYAKKAAEYRRKERMQELPSAFISQDKPHSTRAKQTRPRPQYGFQPSVSHSRQNTAFNSACDECNSIDSSYNKNQVGEFVVSEAKINTLTRTTLIIGRVKSGGFSTGDSIIINSSLEARDAIIGKITRQGAVVTYANSSSGEVMFLFTSIHDLLIRPGDTIIKPKTKFFAK